MNPVRYIRLSTICDHERDPFSRRHESIFSHHFLNEMEYNESQPRPEGLSYNMNVHLPNPEDLQRGLKYIYA